jgi:hypothetical protein
MNNIHVILPVLALALAIGALVKPSWPLIPVAVILLAVDLLVKS